MTLYNLLPTGPRSQLSFVITDWGKAVGSTKRRAYPSFDNPFRRQLMAHRLQLRSVAPPSPNGTRVRFFSDLNGASGRDSRILLIKAQALVFPLQAEKLDQSPRIGFHVRNDILIRDIKKCARKRPAPMVHQAPVPRVVSRHFFLIIGMKIGVGE